jgi:hypothetical protein
LTQERRAKDPLSSTNSHKADGLNSKLKELWQGWVRVSKKIGDFQARLLLSLFYLVLLVLGNFLVAKD